MTLIYSINKANNYTNTKINYNNENIIISKKSKHINPDSINFKNTKRNISQNVKNKASEILKITTLTTLLLTPLKTCNGEIFHKNTAKEMTDLPTNTTIKPDEYRKKFTKLETSKLLKINKIDSTFVNDKQTQKILNEAGFKIDINNNACQSFLNQYLTLQNHKVNIPEEVAEIYDRYSDMFMEYIETNIFYNKTVSLSFLKTYDNCCKSFISKIDTKAISGKLITAAEQNLYEIRYNGSKDIKERLKVCYNKKNYLK